MKKLLDIAVTAVLAAVLAVGASLYWTRHHVPRFVKVDLLALFDEQKADLEKAIKPGMTKEEQGKLFEAATTQIARMDTALTQLAAECDCAILNAAAIAKLPEGSDAGVPDMTARVRALLAGTQ
jgi:hypothetical protein